MKFIGIDKDTSLFYIRKKYNYYITDDDILEGKNAYKRFTNAAQKILDTTDLIIKEGDRIRIFVVNSKGYPIMAYEFTVVKKYIGHDRHKTVAIIRDFYNVSSNTSFYEKENEK